MLNEVKMVGNSPRVEGDTEGLEEARLAEQRDKEKGSWGEARDASRGHAGPGVRLSSLVSTPRLSGNYQQHLGHDETCIWRRRSFCCVYWGWGGRGQVGTYCSNVGEIYQDRGAGWWCWRWRQLERCERCSGSSWVLLLVGVNGPKDKAQSAAHQSAERNG